jgi:hypothetical protein
MNEHVIEALRHSKKIIPLLMEQIESDSMCSELTKFFANVKVTTRTLNKPDKQDPMAPAKDFRPIGSESGEPYNHKIAQNPIAREMNSFFDSRLVSCAKIGTIPTSKLLR